MAKLMGGEPSLTKQIGSELNEDTPPWDQLQGQTRDYAEEAAKLGQLQPRKGSKESWSKLTASFSEHAAALDKAVQNKDKDAGLEAHKEIMQSCRACHQEHRPMRGPGGMPGGFGPGMLFGSRLLAQLDTDKDKKLSRSELVAGVKQFFKDTDKDNKGALDKKALTEGVKSLLPPVPQMPQAGPGGPVRPGNPVGRMEEEVANNIFTRADSNKDGKVTLEELVAAAEALFNEMDKDKKEKLDEREVGAGINKLFPALPPPPGGRGMPGGPGGPGGPGMFPPPPPAPPG